MTEEKKHPSEADQATGILYVKNAIRKDNVYYRVLDNEAKEEDFITHLSDLMEKIRTLGSSMELTRAIQSLQNCRLFINEHRQRKPLCVQTNKQKE